MASASNDRSSITAEVIDLNGKPMIKVCHGKYLVGYFYSTREAEERLKALGYSMAQVEIMESALTRE